MKPCSICNIYQGKVICPEVTKLWERARIVYQDAVEGIDTIEKVKAAEKAILDHYGIQSWAFSIHAVDVMRREYRKLDLCCPSQLQRMVASGGSLATEAQVELELRGPINYDCLGGK